MITMSHYKNINEQVKNYINELNRNSRVENYHNGNKKNKRDSIADLKWQKKKSVSLKAGQLR